MYKLLKSILFNTTILLILFTEINCTRNFDATIPSYVEIQNFDYYGNSPGSTPFPNNYQSINITDAWVTMDGQALGVFQIPCTIPILNSGLHSFTIYPGIKVNGIAGNRIKYPFYKSYEIDTIISLDQTIELQPTTSYKDQVIFDFESEGQFELAGNGTILEATNISDTVAIIQDQTVFQGTKSAAIYLDSTNSYFDIRNIEPLELSFNTFLEMNFKSNINFNVGLIIINESDLEVKKELIQLYPTQEWKKIYLDLAPLISMGNMFSKFKIYFEGYYHNNESNNAIYLDNLKLISTE